MDKLHEILRLVMTSTLGNREIAQALRIAKNTVRRYRALATDQTKTWEELSALTPEELSAAFSKSKGRLTQKRMPNFAFIHEEMQSKGTTLLLLWEEYRLIDPNDALSYSQFTHHYREFTKTVNLSMRQMHRPGDRGFVDFSGKRPSYTNRETGQQVFVELFVGVLGYSNYSFALAVPTQGLPDWIYANVEMLKYFGGCPKAIVPDNLRSAVTKAGREPIINRTYEDMATHYGTVILPTRPYRPKDKGKVEVAVQIVQRWILARLRHRTFFSIAELNQTIFELLEELNRRPFKRLPGCRRDRFEQKEKEHLLPLPDDHYEFSEWFAVQKVGNDYHIRMDGHWYSVPYRLVGKSVEARATRNIVEIFHAHQRVASHLRSFEHGAHTTDITHAPEAHRAQANRTPEQYYGWAKTIGPNVEIVVKHQFDRKYPTLGIQACESLVRLGRQYGIDRLEAAATRAIEIKSPTVKSIKSLLSLKRPLKDITGEPVSSNLPLHQNVRGANYYNESEDLSC